MTFPDTRVQSLNLPCRSGSAFACARVFGMSQEKTAEWLCSFRHRTRRQSLGHFEQTSMCRACFECGIVIVFARAKMHELRWLAGPVDPSCLRQVNDMDRCRINKHAHANIHTLELQMESANLSSTTDEFRVQLMSLEYDELRLA